MRPHTTHFDDCGCLTARLAAAEAREMALLELVGHMDGALMVSAEFAAAVQPLMPNRSDVAGGTHTKWRAIIDALDKCAVHVAKTVARVAELDALLSAPPGDRSALRAMLVEAWECGLHAEELTSEHEAARRERDVARIMGEGEGA